MFDIQTYMYDIYYLVFSEKDAECRKLVLESWFSKNSLNKVFEWGYINSKIKMKTNEIVHRTKNNQGSESSETFSRSCYNLNLDIPLCVGRCTTRNKLNKGVTWSISLNLWSICIYASKTKSICEPFFDWIKITDFFIVKLTIFWEWKMTPKNSQFCYKKSVILIQSKKGSHIDFVFDA